jgi:glycosyltransferase involved in cell wall biosynthesis
MNVLQLAKFYAPAKGGIETVVLELSQGLRRRGVEVQVLCAGSAWRTQRDRSPEGIDIVRAGSLGSLQSTSMAPALVRHLRRMAPDADVIHVHMPDPMAALALWAAQPRGKVIVHWHSDVVRQRTALRLYGPLQQWLLRRADAIVATSEAYARSSPWLPAWRNKTVVIPIGISDHRELAQAATVRQIRQRFGYREIVFALGRMTYYKGFDVLVEATAHLPERCVVVVGGDGELLEQHRTQARKRGLAGRIHFVGRIPDDELPSYFAAASMFCLPSTQRAEAYGVVLLEAMAMGKPVIATEIAGSAVPWVNDSGTTGLNVPVGDARALADAVIRIATDKACAARFGVAARARYEQCLSADAMVRDTMALYGKLIAQPQQPTRFEETGTVFGNDR